MNCKPGDMAYVVRAYKKRLNLGRVVQCLQFIGNVPGLSGDDLWLVDSMMYWSFGPAPYAPDHCLRPHRPGDLHETEDDLNEVSA